MAKQKKKSLENELDEISLAKRTLERGKENEDFIDELYSQYDFTEGCDCKKRYKEKEPTIKQKYEKVKDWLDGEDEEHVADRVINTADEHDVEIFKMGESQIVKISKNTLHEYMKSGTKIEHLDEVEMNLSDVGDHFLSKYQAILKNMPKGANAYTERTYVEHWERHEQWDSSGNDLCAHIDYYKIEE